MSRNRKLPNMTSKFCAVAMFVALNHKKMCRTKCVHIIKCYLLAKVIQPFYLVT
jgi:hypothetical protein